MVETKINQNAVAAHLSRGLETHGKAHPLQDAKSSPMGAFCAFSLSIARCGQNTRTVPMNPCSRDKERDGDEYDKG